MALYAYTLFDGLTLPLAMIDEDVGSDDSDEQMVEVPGRLPFDALGAAQAPGLPRVVTAQFTATGADLAALQTTLDDLRAKRGVKGTLTLALSGGGTRTQTARLLRVDMQRGMGPERAQEVELTFRMYGDCWRGVHQNRLVTLSSTPISAGIPNDGNEVCRAVTITVTAAGSAISAVKIENLKAGHVSSITYSANIAAGASLVIDCAACSVKNAGASDYAHLALDAAHTITEWLRLAPGSNTVRITRTGGGTDSTCTLDYYDTWV